MIPEFFVLVSFFYHFGWVANLIIKRADQKQFDTLAELTQAVANWIQYYNFTRIKTKLGGKSPVKYRVLTTQKVA